MSHRQRSKIARASPRHVRQLRVGEYILSRVLGSGTFATVRLACHEKT